MEYPHLVSVFSLLLFSGDGNPSFFRDTNEWKIRKEKVDFNPSKVQFLAKNLLCLVEFLYKLFLTKINRFVSQETWLNSK